METFSSVVLKKEFDELVSKVIPSLADCGKCEKFCCSYCRKFSVACTWCRNERCKNCYKFANLLNILLENGSEASRQYTANFVDDFFSVSDILAKIFNFEVTEIEQKKRERVNLVKSCVKSHKCRTQVVNQSLKNMQKIKQF